MKILKTLYTATLCAAMAVSTSSCLNSWLDQSPADGIDAETAIKNSDDLANVRTGLELTQSRNLIKPQYTDNNQVITNLLYY